MNYSRVSDTDYYDPDSGKGVFSNLNVITKDAVSFDAP